MYYEVFMIISYVPPWLIIFFINMLIYSILTFAVVVCPDDMLEDAQGVQREDGGGKPRSIYVVYQ